MPVHRNQKKGDERMEAKLDHILKTMDPENSNKLIRELEQKFPKK